MVLKRVAAVACRRYDFAGGTMTRAELLAFMRTHVNAVQATVSPDGSPQAAVVGIAVSDSFEVIFDSLDNTRKARNLDVNPKIALVMGGWTQGDERTVQYQGVVDRPRGAELEALKAVYYATFPGGPARLAWPGLVYLRARPTWIRYTDFGKNPVERIELDSEQLKALT
jgi:Pyridoxamine 5'-phosphate oxidase